MSSRLLSLLFLYDMDFSGFVYYLRFEVIERVGVVVERFGVWILILKSLRMGTMSFSNTDLLRERVGNLNLAFSLLWLNSLVQGWQL